MVTWQTNGCLDLPPSLWPPTLRDPRYDTEINRVFSKERIACEQRKFMDFPVHFRFAFNLFIASVPKQKEHIICKYLKIMRFYTLFITPTVYP